MTARTAGTRRILVCLDAGPGGVAALEHAATLAAELQAELAGLFVEDINLFRLCELPGREVSLSGGVSRQPAQATLERELRARADDARRRLERTAQARRVAWSFQITRGHHEAALMDAAREADLVALGRVLRPLADRHPVARHRRVATTRRLPAPVVVLFEGGDGGVQVLDLAVRAARQRRAPVLVIVPARNPAQARERGTAVQSSLAERGVISAIHVVSSGRSAIYKALAEARGRLLLLDASGPAVAKGMLHDMMQEAGCEAVLVSAGLTPAQGDAASNSPT